MQNNDLLILKVTFPVLIDTYRCLMQNMKLSQFNVETKS